MSDNVNSGAQSTQDVVEYGLLTECQGTLNIQSNVTSNYDGTINVKHTFTPEYFGFVTKIATDRGEEYEPLQGVVHADNIAGNRGTQGFKGADGAQGYQGCGGYNGDQGKQGYQGYQGLKGDDGIQGYQGYQGYPGEQGLQGYQGYQGISGNQGDQGYQGYQGYAGIEGDQGYQGYRGISGEQGLQGYQGYQGLAGNPGSQGYQGYQGATGSDGTPGTAMCSSATANATASTLALRNGTAQCYWYNLYVSGSLYESSDIKLKDIIGDISEIDLLKKLYNLRKIKYTLKGDNKVQIGLIAQEVKEVFPELVTEDAAGYLTVNYEKLNVLVMAGLSIIDKQLR